MPADRSIEASGEVRSSLPDERVLTIPNALSVLRLLGVPVFLWLLLGPHADVAALVARAVSPLSGRPDVRSAAVCVWPDFADIAADLLAGSGVALACVAGAFPFSHAPLAVKVAEVAAAVKAGATEIDIAINRGLFLAGEHDALREEIAAMKADGSYDRLLRQHGM